MYNIEADDSKLENENCIRCIVPCCPNTTDKTPEKVFFVVPTNKTRKLWFKAMKRNEIPPSVTVYCCEDHFIIEVDTVSIASRRREATLHLKRGILPHIFECQKSIINDMQRKPRKDKNRARIKQLTFNKVAINAVKQWSSCQRGAEIELSTRIHPEPDDDQIPPEPNRQHNPLLNLKISREPDDEQIPPDPNRQPNPLLNLKISRMPSNLNNSTDKDLQKLSTQIDKHILKSIKKSQKTKKMPAKKPKNNDESSLNKIKKNKQNSLVLTKASVEDMVTNFNLFGYGKRSSSLMIKMGLTQMLKEELARCLENYKKHPTESKFKRQYKFLLNRLSVSHDHDYALYELTPKRPESQKHSSKEKIELNENFLRINECNRSVKEVNAETAIDFETDSAESIETFCCEQCSTEFIDKNTLYRHIQDHHFVFEDNLDDINIKPEIFQTPKRQKSLKPFPKEKTELNENFLRINECNRSIKEVNAETVIDFETDSAESIETFCCEQCSTEFIDKNTLHQHIQDHHFVFKDDLDDIDIKPEIFQTPKRQKSLKPFPKEKTELNENFLRITEFNRSIKEVNAETVIDFETDSAESIETFCCEQCSTEFIDKNTLHQHIQDHHFVFEDDLDDIDIKPEIFQCNKCPMSFISEDEMSKHLHFMHGDIIEIHLHNSDISPTQSEQVTNDNSIVNYTNEDDIHAEGRFEEHNLDNPMDMQVTVQIKREMEEPLEIDQSLQNLIASNDFDQILNDNYLSLNDCMPDLQIHEVCSISKNNCFNFESNGTYNSIYTSGIIRQNYLDSNDSSKSLATIKCTNCCLDFVTKKDLAAHNKEYHSKQQDYKETNLIQCKTCSTSFSNQEELLDHMHELMNTKTHTKGAINCSTSVKKIKHSNDVDNTMIFNEAELLENVHRVFNDLKKKKHNYGTKKQTKSKPSCTITKPSELNTIEDIVQNTENDLLKPLRVEEERILVKPYNPNVCKSCLKPLETNAELNKDITCEKCKSVEAGNKKPKKKRRVSKLTVKKRRRTQYKFECNICGNKFNSKVELKKHAIRSHL